MRAVCGLLLLAACVCAAETVGGLHWSSWDAQQTCQPTEFIMPASEKEVADAVMRAASIGSKIKVVGAGHSFSPIALTDGIMVNLDRLNDIIEVKRHVDGNFSHVTVGAGIRLRDLNEKLENISLALENMGATAAQSIAGATSTGTHGTGTALGSISTQIVGLRIITASGESIDVDESSAIFNATRVGLGALGIIVRVTLRVVDSFRMQLDLIPWDLDVLMMDLPRLLERNPRLQWYWTPYSVNATVVVRTPTEDAITGCWPTLSRALEENVGANGIVTASTCVDVSYKTLTDSFEQYSRRTLYTEMEMFVPVDQTKAAVNAFLAFQQSVVAKHGAGVSLFTGVRYVAADEIWLSPQYKRDNSVISMIVSGDRTKTGSPEEFAMYAHGLENVTATSFQARPHWGKMNYAKSADFAAAYPRWNDFKTLREKMDPQGIFLNDYLQSLFQ